MIVPGLRVSSTAMHFYNYTNYDMQSQQKHKFLFHNDFWRLNRIVMLNTNAAKIIAYGNIDVDLIWFVFWFEPRYCLHVHNIWM